MCTVAVGVARERLEQGFAQADERPAVAMLHLRVQGRRDIADRTVEGRGSAKKAARSDQRAREPVIAFGLDVETKDTFLLARRATCRSSVVGNL